MLHGASLLVCANVGKQRNSFYAQKFTTYKQLIYDISDCILYDVSNLIEQVTVIHMQYFRTMYQAWFASSL